VEKNVGIFILCCNRLLRETIARILAKRTNFEVIGVQAPGANALDEIANSGADVLVLDSLQTLLEDASVSARTHPGGHSIKCVLVAMEDDRKHFLTAIRRGVLAYVLQDASAVDVLAAIRAVALGEAICPPRYARYLFDFVAAQDTELPNNRTRTQLGLTRREQQLIPLIGRGLTNKEIANELSLSEQTVKNHIHRILRKVGVEDRLSVLEACQTQSVTL
jgi:two-component system, NarL family, response regulator DevR